ncbi:TetR/AcrR family transcriptional regulator [Spongiactinospora sp. 9N601]|uniref:TetR/AcrR family transcriptional regulator n=1 Tax=Spongiactinospora sp. 9N601 TaxID=3375149 RepID=UPI0037B1CA76
MPAQASQNGAVKAGRLRADARDNRERILKAAREAYAAQGIDVPISAIARRAGVGVATLYRRFPTRASLIAEAFAEQFAACAATLDDALADPDPWRGFCSLIEKVAEMQIADRGFTAAFMSRFPSQLDHERVRARAERDIAVLVRRAQQAGRLRPDFDPTDVFLLLRANCALAEEAAPLSYAASRRLVGYLLQAFEAGQAKPLPPPAALGVRQMHESLARGRGM